MSAFRQAGHPWDDAGLAALYDAFPFDGDLDFYIAEARRTGGPVLEAGCGTGRALLPLARAGLRVTGVDVSTAMLAIARDKVEADTPAVQSRVRLVPADMRTVDAGAGSFGLAFIPTKTFAYFTRREDQQAVLATLARHLAPGGTLVVDLIHPTRQWLHRPAGSVYQDVASWHDGRYVMRTETMVETDLATQVRTIRSVYDVIEPDGTSVKRVVEWPFRYTYRFEAELLLEGAGLEVAHVYGDYDRSPFGSDSGNLLMVARKPV